jgi:hypothetical protein
MLVWRAASQAELGERGGGRDRGGAAAPLPEASFESLMNTGWIFEREQEQRQILASARKAGVRVCATEEEAEAVSLAATACRMLVQASGLIDIRAAQPPPGNGYALSAVALLGVGPGE